MRYRDLIMPDLASKMLDLCKQELELAELPDIKLVEDGATVGGGFSFGEFDGVRNISVAITGRHPLDVMRTLAHELVHWKQLEDGQILDGADGSDTEDEANALAGTIMRKFGRMYPQYFLTDHH